MTKTDHLAETAADVAALIPRFSWELMDEEQRDALMASVVVPRYMKATADGVKLSPKWWGDAVGATAEAIRSRVKRLRESQNSSDDGRARALSDSRVRHLRSALRDPEKRKQAIASLSHDERADLVTEVAAAPAPSEPAESRKALRDHMQDAVAVDLSAQVAKLIAGASRIDLLLAERGAEFRRINAEQAERFDADLERVMNTIRDVRGELLKHRQIEVAS